MNPILVDFQWKSLLPLTFAKPVSHLLVGVDTIREKWERYFECPVSTATVTHLVETFPSNIQNENLIINASVIPSQELMEAISNMNEGEVLTYSGKIVACQIDEDRANAIFGLLDIQKEWVASDFGPIEVALNFPCQWIDTPSDIFAQNDAILRKDFDELIEGNCTTEFPIGVSVSGSNIFIHPEAIVSHCILNAEAGPIYIGKGAEIMEGALVRGPFALGEHSALKMGAKIYGATSIGAHCKVGGEVSNSIINDYSNKGHDGFLGNSVIGSWCNLGADTNTSNLKNNYGLIKVWDYKKEDFALTGRQFHGLIMGDHSKSSINTMFNTGTVVGMCANVFDGGFPPKFIPSFSWGGANGIETFDIDKAFEASTAMMERRNVEFSETDRRIFRFVSDHDMNRR